MAHTNTATTNGAMAKSWRGAATAMETAYNDAIASTGRFRVAQQKVGNVTDDFIKRVNQQKVSFRDLRREMTTVQAAYKEQLKLQNAVVSSFRTDAAGNTLANLAIPNTINKDLDGVRNRLGYVRALTESIGTQTINWGKNTQWAGRQMTVGMTYPLALLAAAAGTAAFSVDQNLTRIAKVYDTTATEGIEREKELEQVRVDGLRTARSAANEYGAAVKDTLDIQAQWAAIGTTGKELQEATNETMRLATLGEIDHQTAMNATISLQNVFKMSTLETADAINYMNAVENATVLSLEDFATAIPIAAAPVKQLGGDIQDLGTMLTAMKARGIDANEGANAIKSAMTRIFRPSKQIRKEFQDLTGTDITALVEKSNGELIPTLQAIGEAVDGLSNIDRTKAVAGLFGTYQNTRLSGLLTGMFEDFDDENSQVFRALEAAQNSAADNAETAANEMAEIQESASGRIKRAWESLKANLAADGMGFLSLGADMLEMANNVMGAWDSMPEFFKQIAKYGAIAAAVIGPIVMTVGVLGNAWGMGLRTFAKFLPKVEFLTTAEKANKAALAELKTITDQASLSTEGLTVEVQALTNALTEAGIAKQKYNEKMAGVGAPGKTTKSGGQEYSATAAGLLLPVEHRNRGGGPLTGKGLENREDALYGADAKTALENDKALTEEARKRNALMSSMALSSGLIATGTTVQMFTSNETATSVASWMTSMGMGLIALQSIVPLAKGAGTAFKGMAANVGKRGILGSLGGFKAAFNPWLFGLAAAGASAYLIYKHVKDASDAIVKMRTDAGGLGDIFGFEATSTATSAAEGGTDALSEKVAKLKEEYPALVDSIVAANGDFSESFNRAAQAGILAFNHGATEEQARDVVRTALAAANGEAFANAVMLQFEFDPNNVQQVAAAAVQAMQDGMASIDAGSGGMFYNVFGQKTDEAEALGKQVGEMYGQGIVGALSSEDYTGAADMFNKMNTEIIESTKEMKNQGAAFELARQSVTAYGESVGMSASQIEKIVGDSGWAEYISASNMAGVSVDMQDVISGWLTEMQSVKTEYSDLLAASTGLVSIQENIANLEAGRKSNLEGMSSDLALNDQEMMNQYSSALDIIAATGEITSLTWTQQKVLGEILATQGIDINNRQAMLVLQQMLNSASAHGVALESLKANVQSTVNDKFNADLKAQAATTKSNNDAAIAAIEKQQDAQDAAHKRQDNNLEAQHKRETRLLKIRWDNREKNLEKERELNKKKYDDELAFIKRTLDAQNRQTDITVAMRMGDLDEVARLQAEGTAAGQTDALERARDASDSRYGDRMDNLKARREAAEENLKVIQEKEKNALQARQAREKAALQERLKMMRQETNAVSTNTEEQKAAHKKKLDDFLAKLNITSVSSKKEMVALGNELRDKFGLTTKQITKVFEDMWGDVAADETIPTSSKNAMKSWIIGAGKELGLSYGKALSLAKKSLGGMQNSANGGRTSEQARDAKHAGGAIGGKISSGSRAGYPRGASNFPSEVDILAKKSEYVMSSRAHRTYGTGLLDAVNRGEATIARHTGGAIASQLQMGLKGMTDGVGTASGRYVARRMKKEDADAAGANGVVGGGGFKKPTGTWNSPWKGHKVTNNGHDYNLRTEPLYAPRDGKVSTYALPGTEPRARHGGNGFRSYGQYIKWSGAGQSMMFAHLSKLPFAAGGTKSIKAGQYMGTSGNTGNSSGAHVHVELPFGAGNNGNFGAFFRAAGVSLRKGGKLRYDNTLVNAHKGETVLSSRITKAFENNLLSSTGGGNTYGNINVTITGDVKNPIDTGRKVAMGMKQELDREENRYGRQR